MALKGSAGGRGGAPGGVSPDVTWDSGYTEAPDETAHGEYMKPMASAGLAFDRVHLNYLAHAKLRITRTEREQGGKVAELTGVGNRAGANSLEFTRPGPGGSRIDGATALRP